MYVRLRIALVSDVIQIELFVAYLIAVRRSPQTA